MKRCLPRFALTDASSSQSLAAAQQAQAAQANTDAPENHRGLNVQWANGRSNMRLLWAMTLACLALPSTSHAELKIVLEEFRVPHENGIEIYVRNKRPDGIQTFASERIAVLVHGATYPSNSFDLGLAGKSWMDYLAERGFDVYALDLPGYGRSTRPAIMEQPAEDNPPFLRTADAVRALGTVVDFVGKRRGVERIDLIGWSWGTAITATYAAENPSKVERLMLY